MNSTQYKIWDTLCCMDSVDVASAFANYFGYQILDDGFLQFLKDEGFIEEDYDEDDDEEEGAEDNED